MEIKKISLSCNLVLTIVTFVLFIYLIFLFKPEISEETRDIFINL